ncbi:unnamed protein product [Pleuronectes platessa]|uniref:Uncharacterized protein n=1 Tax=Pleuronectes platessa TaxID=8262 RepID=A0A9N7Z454_PLEPL|nr:unnamed protein product [Pleuronectes platessa]
MAEQGTHQFGHRSISCALVNQRPSLEILYLEVAALSSPSLKPHMGYVTGRCSLEGGRAGLAVSVGVCTVCSRVGTSTREERGGERGRERESESLNKHTGGERRREESQRVLTSKQEREEREGVRES